MTRYRLLLIGALAPGALFVPTATAMASARVASTACADSWKAAVSGPWSDGGDWTAGVPGEGAPVAVCITVAGTYTVTLAPWSVGTADPNHQGAAVESLTIGATGGRGRQTLLIDGVSSTNNSNEQVNDTGLSTTSPSVIRARGRLVLATTDGGTRPKGVPYGGYASVGGAPFINYGKVAMTVQDPRNKAADSTQFYGALINEPGGTVTDQSGLLLVNSVSNHGTLTVAPRASMDLAAQPPDGLPSGVFTNAGTIDNGGTISAQAGTWSQLGGRVTGNTVALQDGTKLVDHAGVAKFVVNSASASLVGRVPAGQTITVVGSPTATRARTITARPSGWPAQPSSTTGPSWSKLKVPRPPAGRPRSAMALSVTTATSWPRWTARRGRSTGRSG